jgi:hypothetical protein
MEDGTLNHLRNRVINRPAYVSKPLERKSGKAKPQPAPVDMRALNRRERRNQRRGKDSRTKNKSMAFAQNEAFGASQFALGTETNADQDNSDSDGGFFED